MSSGFFMRLSPPCGMRPIRRAFSVHRLAWNPPTAPSPAPHAIAQAPPRTPPPRTVARDQPHEPQRRPGAETVREMTREQNIASQQAFGEAVNAGEFARVRPSRRPRLRRPRPGARPGARSEGVRGVLRRAARTAFPDMALEVEKLVADDDNVAFAYTMTGTQTASSAVTHRRPSGEDPRVQISSFVDGKLVGAGGAATSSASSPRRASRPTLTIVARQCSEAHPRRRRLGNPL